MIDSTRIGLIGHSMGGNAVVRFAQYDAAYVNLNVGGIVALNPATLFDSEQDFSNIEAPIMFVTGVDDMAVAW